ncbi:helix-turn-helix domain-containing protein [Methylobacterium sp. E-016]|uniref:helix-turn-helix domain-containing protein n=1 Tax=Methylobacterium sp. E-016 TaxID=2836556 RepID=UPI00391A1D7D
MADNAQLGAFCARRLICSSEDEMITPAQCRAARALLQLSQKQLADESGISLRSVQGFEAGERSLQGLAMSALEGVLAVRGIVMIADSKWIGVKFLVSHSPD